MSGPFKMNGSSALGYGNQHSKGAVKMYNSPAKETGGVKIDMNDPKTKATYEKYKNNADYRKAMNKKAGGKFDYDEKSNTSTTTTPVTPPKVTTTNNKDGSYTKSDGKKSTTYKPNPNYNPKSARTGNYKYITGEKNPDGSPIGE